MGLVNMKGEATVMGTLAAMYETGLAQELLDLAIMDPAFSCTQNVMTSLGSLIEYALLVCRRHRYAEVEHCLNLLSKDVLASKTGACR
eukprot:2993490-Heterocapsa_arctica.AAC.1